MLSARCSSYRLAGVDKDQATRDRLQALHEKATRLSLEFSRNIQEGGKTIEATAGRARWTARRLHRPPSGQTPRAASRSPPTSPTCSR